MTHHLTIDPHFATLVPHFAMAMVEAQVVNTPYSIELQREIDREVAHIALTQTMESIKQMESIHFTRNAYKILGKDPNRYRPAAEQLSRRIVNKKGLYTINAIVDLGNLLSLITGFSMGLFDAPSVGRDVVMRVGTNADQFEGIGRGELNVEGLPLYCDKQGPFANPTSDSERTKVKNNTSELLLFINSFTPSEQNAKEALIEATELTISMLKRFLNAKEIVSQYHSAKETLLLS